GRVVLEVALARLMIGARDAEPRSGLAATASVQDAASTSPALSREPAAGGGRRMSPKVPSPVKGVPSGTGGEAPVTGTAGEQSARETPVRAGDAGAPPEFDPFEHEELPPLGTPRRAAAAARTSGEGHRPPSAKREPPVEAGDGATSGIEAI